MASVFEPLDLTNCDREPIHLIGAVQPFGLLLAASNKTGLVTRVSESVEDWLGLAPVDVLGQPIAAVLSPDTMHKIRGQLHAAITGDTVARMFDVPIARGRPNCDVAAHMVDDTIVIECEPTDKEGDDNTGLMVRGMIARL